MIHVIWIDDNCRDSEGQLTELGTQIVDQAWNYDIDIEAFDQYKPALKTLQSNPSRYSAIILDIRNEKAEIDSVTSDYHKMKLEVEKIKTKYQSSEPYVFSFSGIDQYYNSDLIIKEDYASRSVYAKPNESALLFQDIKKIAVLSDFYKVRQDFKDVFSVVELLKWQGIDENRLFKILYRINYKGFYDDDSLLNDIRKVIETIMPHLEDKSIIPKNLPLNEKGKMISNNKEIPGYVRYSFYSLILTTQQGSHAKLKIPEDIKNGDAPYVLRSCMYELCNIIIWLGKVVNNNQLI